MITAVDTSVLLDVLRPNPNFVDRSLAAIEASTATGPLVMCDPVYAELAASFERAGRPGRLPCGCRDSPRVAER